MKYVISSSYGNDSVALIQWAHEKGLQDVTVAYSDTGWGSPDWPARVERGEVFARSLGFETARIKSMGMVELVRMKKGFPGTGPQQFCTLHLKGVPFLMWIDEVDPEGKAVILIGKRRAESARRKDTPEFVESSEYHGGRKLWHALYAHTDEMRNELLARAGFEVLPHRSMECSPCVYANRGDFRRVPLSRINEIADLELEIGKPMFRPKRFKALGIYKVIEWAKRGHGKYDKLDEIPEEGCSEPFGCGL